jgi:hypothetical protein
LPGYGPPFIEVEDNWAEEEEEECELPLFLEDSQGLHNISPMEFDTRNSRSMSPHFSAGEASNISALLSHSPPNETPPQDPERTPSTDETTQFPNDSYPQTIVSTDVTEQKTKRKISFESLGTMVLEEDWISSVRTRGQLRMILEPVVVKREPESRTSSSNGLMKHTHKGPKRKQAVFEKVLFLLMDRANCRPRLLIGAFS